MPNWLVVQFDAIIYFSKKNLHHIGQRYAIRLIVLVQNNQRDGRIERDLSKLQPQRKWSKTKVSQEQWNKTNVRIQVKPKLNKFHIFLHFRIPRPQKLTRIAEWHGDVDV